MSEAPQTISDRELLASWRRERTRESLLVLVRRYVVFVHASASRRTGNNALVEEITRAVFLVFARRARKLPPKTVLAEWFFATTRLATRKAQGSRLWPWKWFRKPARVPTEAPLWLRIAPRFDFELDRLPRRRRSAFLLLNLLGASAAEATETLRTNERRVVSRATRAIKTLAKRLRKVGCSDADTLTRELSQRGGSSLSIEQIAELEALIDEAISRRPRQRLARRVLSSLALTRWRRRVRWTFISIILLLTIAGTIAWQIDARTGHSQLIAWYIELNVRHEAKTVPGLAVPAKRWMPSNSILAAGVRSAADIFRVTNIWPVHLSFSPEAWKKAQPKRIGAMPHFLVGDGTIHLRNPEAHRSGVAGVLGFDFDWTSADLEIADARFTNVAARLKGNGTFLSSLHGDKRAFKVDLNKFAKEQKLGGCDEFAFNNLVVDQSFVSDALAYEFFRNAGVPAPRTAYAYLSVTVSNQWNHKPLGLYALVESIDEKFAANRFGSKKAALFKPVTYELFKYLGENWSAYETIYDAKTKLTADQERRVIGFAKLLSRASNEDFAQRVGEFLDLDECARFFACQVLLANYDGIFSNGQNLYLYLDPRSDKFGFIPWDLDLAWGSFFLVATTEERERASIWHPWIGQNRFLERLFADESFKKLYRARLEECLSTLFIRERLFARIDEIAAVIRPAIAAESDFRLARFEKAVSDRWQEAPPRTHSQGADRPVHQIKRFIEKRAHFVRLQLDGKSRGMILQRGSRDN